MTARDCYRPWSHAEGPRGFRVRVFEDRTSPNIMLDIRDWRQPDKQRYRTLSLGHHDRERAVRYARVLSRWWRRTGNPPRMMWRRGRGPLPKGCIHRSCVGAGDIAGIRAESAAVGSRRKAAGHG